MSHRYRSRSETRVLRLHTQTWLSRIDVILGTVPIEAALPPTVFAAVTAGCADLA